MNIKFLNTFFIASLLQVGSAFADEGTRLDWKNPETRTSWAFFKLPGDSLRSSSSAEYLCNTIGYETPYLGQLESEFGLMIDSNIGKEFLYSAPPVWLVTDHTHSGIRKGLVRYDNWTKKFKILIESNGDLGGSVLCRQRPL